MLIIGCGNLDRADDAAGLRVAAKLREMGVNARQQCGDMLALIDEWSDAEEVILIDAAITGAAPGTITTWDARHTPLPQDCFPCSTHALGVAEVVELARALNGLPSKLTIYGIEAGNFEPGDSLSPEVAVAVERAALVIAAATHWSPLLAALPKSA